MLKLRCTVWLFVALAGCSQCVLCRGQEADVSSKLIQKLVSAKDIAGLLFDGLSVEEKRVKYVGDKPEPRELLTYDQLSHGVWRLNTEGPSPVSIVRDDDFWFVAYYPTQKRIYDFERLGFDRMAESSINASRLSHLNSLLSASHVLEMSVAEFASRQGMSFKRRSQALSSESTDGLDWTYTVPTNKEGYDAFGFLEWKEFANALFLTHWSYRFGKPSPSNNNAGVSATIAYTTSGDSIYPVTIRREEPGFDLISEVSVLGPARQDRDWYSPEAFGLSRPTKPLAAWIWWSVIGVCAGLVAWTCRVVATRKSIRSE